MTLICVECETRQSISNEVLARKVVQAYIDQQNKSKTHTVISDPITYV